MTLRWALLQLRHHKLLLTAAVGLGALTVLASVGLMGTSGYLISRAAQRPPILDLMLAIVAVRFFGISRGAVRYAERMVSHDLTFRLLLRLRCWMYERLEPIIPGRCMSYHSGDLLSRLVADVETLQNLYLRVASPLIVAGIVTATTTGILWLLDPAVAVTVLIGLGLGGIVLPWATLSLARTTAHQQVVIRAALQRHLVESIGGMEEMLALGLEAIRLKDHEQMTHQLARLQRRQTFIGGLHQFVGNLVTWSTIVGVLLIVVPKIQAAEFPPILLAAAAFGVLASFEAIQPLPAAYQYLGQANEASQRIYEVIAEPPPIENTVDPAPVPAVPSFAFRNVTFTFPGAERPAISNASFDLPFGQRVAILGPSGAGKSAIVYLLCRFSDPQQGTVFLGEFPLRKYSAQQVRAQLSVVLQRPHIFNSSIRKNLLLARPEATDSELMGALEQAGLASFVENLPTGLDTLAGAEGSTFSGGQRQRLALAQAFLKDAPILVLDEATANLDPETERDVLDRVFQLTTGRTLVVITHRPENLFGLDAVLTLRDGQLVA